MFLLLQAKHALLPSPSPTRRLSDLRHEGRCSNHCRVYQHSSTPGTPSTAAPIRLTTSLDLLLCQHPELRDGPSQDSWSLESHTSSSYHCHRATSPLCNKGSDFLHFPFLNPISVVSTSLQPGESFCDPDFVLRVLSYPSQIQVICKFDEACLMSASKSLTKDVQGTLGHFKKSPSAFALCIKSLAPVALDTIFCNTFNRTGQLNILLGTENSL